MTGEDVKERDFGLGRIREQGAGLLPIEKPAAGGLFAHFS